MHEWVTQGAAFGVKAFFAVGVFLLCCGLVLGVVLLLMHVMEGNDDDDQRPRTL